MAYSSGGLIAATDYNSFANGTNQINQFWNVGSGDAGYGQTALSAVSASGTVTATQWSTMLNYVNAAAAHQGISGVGTLGSSITPGVVATYIANLGTAINNAYSSRLSFASQGSTTAGTVYGYNPSSGSTASALGEYSFTRTVAFSSGDAARYFFNSGGQLNFVTTGVTNNDSNGRSADLVTLIGTNLGSISAFRAHSNGGRSGTSGTLNTNATGIGYYESTVAEKTLVYVTSTSYPYNGDYAKVNVYTSAQNASGHGDMGSTVYIKGIVYLNALQSDFGNKGFNITWNHRIDVVYPESSNLGNSWGTVTIS